MKLKSLNRKRILRQILPSIFFILCIAGYIGEVRDLAVNLIAVGFALLLLGNIFLQNKIISRIMGVVFLLGSCYLWLALMSDVAKGKATLGYVGGAFLILFSIAMSALLILGYGKKKQHIEIETEQCQEITSML